MDISICLNDLNMRLMNPTMTLAGEFSHDHFEISTQNLNAFIQNPLYNCVDVKPKKMLNLLMNAKIDGFKIGFLFDDGEDTLNETIVEPCGFEISYTDQSFKTK